MELPLADLLDRYSIELRKDYYGHGNPEMVKMLASEIKLRLGQPDILRVFNTTMIDTDKAFALVRGAVLLGLRNADIANCEWQIRAGHDLPLEEIGRRALLTRKINDARCEAKQDISKALGENVETRHFGYGKLANLTFAVQVPAVQQDDRPEQEPLVPEAT